MGRSTTSRKPPGWEAENTNRGSEKYSTDYEVPYEGSLISGSTDSMRKGVDKSARTKSGPIAGKKY